MNNEVITSAIAIVNAKRIWRGGSAFDATRDATYNTNNVNGNGDNNNNNMIIGANNEITDTTHNDSCIECTNEISYPADVDGLLIINGTIAFIGSSNGVRERFDHLARLIQLLPNTPRAVCHGRSRVPFARLIDCHHRSAIFPGFIDSHVHFLDGGRQLMSVDLSYADCRTSFIATLRRFVVEHDIMHNNNYYHVHNDVRGEHDNHNGESHHIHSVGNLCEEPEWLFGCGWSETVLGGWPSRDWLDEVCTCVPMVMYSKDMHSCVLNTTALRLCHLLPPQTHAHLSVSAHNVQDDNDKEGNLAHNISYSVNGNDACYTEEAKELLYEEEEVFVLPSIPGGKIETDEDGIANGLLRDNAKRIIDRYAPTRATRENQFMALQCASRYMLERGFTTVFSMMSSRYSDNLNEIRFLQEMEEAGQMPIRVRYAITPNEITPFVDEFYKPLIHQQNSSTAIHVSPINYNHEDDNSNGSSSSSSNSLSMCTCHHVDFTAPFRFTKLPIHAGGGYCILGAVKLISDGSLSSHTAAMTRPYQYDVGTDGDLNSEMDEVAIAQWLHERFPQCECGLLLLSQQQLREAIHTAHEHDLQCCIHAIGDRAVAMTNKVLSESANWLKQRASSSEQEEEKKEYREISQEHNKLQNATAVPSHTNKSLTVSSIELSRRQFRLSPRSRVEHCQHMANIRKELDRMSTHNIIASMQPCHLLFDGDYVESLLGSHRKDKSYLWATLLKHQIHVALGSDWPVAPADANDGLRGAVTRVPDVMSSIAAEARALQQQQEQQQQQHNNQKMQQTTLSKDNQHDNDDISNKCNTLPTIPVNRTLPLHSSSISSEEEDTAVHEELQTIRRKYHAVWNAAECVSMEVALRMYTYESAYAAFMEDVVGTIEVGKWADVVVFAADWLDETEQTALYTDEVHGNGLGGDSQAQHNNQCRWWRPGREPQTEFTIVGGVIEYERATSTS